MFWFHASMKAADDRNFASAAQIMACFQNEGFSVGQARFSYHWGPSHGGPVSRQRP